MGIDLDEKNRFVFTADNIDEIIEKKSMGFSLKRHMNPWFKNQVGVRKADCVYAMTQHEVDEFTKCAIDIHYFANNYCQIKNQDGKIKQMTLRDYQYDILNTYTKNRFTINMSSRQTGKCCTLITNTLCKINGQIINIPMFKLLFKYKNNKMFLDYIKYGIYWLLWKIN